MERCHEVPLPTSASPLTCVRTLLMPLHYTADVPDYRLGWVTWVAPPGTVSLGVLVANLPVALMGQISGADGASAPRCITN